MTKQLRWRPLRTGCRRWRSFGSLTRTNPRFSWSAADYGLVGVTQRGRTGDVPIDDPRLEENRMLRRG